jgi:hypothetical protein
LVFEQKKIFYRWEKKSFKPQQRTFFYEKLINKVKQEWENKFTYTEKKDRERREKLWTSEIGREKRKENFPMPFHENIISYGPLIDRQESEWEWEKLFK